MFGQLSPVFVYQRVGGIHDVLCGAVVLFELEDAQVGVCFLEIKDILDVGAAEGVDALGVVAYHRQGVGALAQLCDDAVLGEVCILILVDEHIAEKLAVMVEHVGVILEQHVGVI